MKLPTALLLVTLFPSAGCGGGAQTPEAPKETNSSASSATSEVEESEPEPSGPDCSDGTCFVCGEGICPTGGYCDEGAPKGAACAFVAECAKTPTCACLKKVLGASCSCEEAGGAPLVRCN